MITIVPINWNCIFMDEQSQFSCSCPCVVYAAIITLQLGEDIFTTSSLLSGVCWGASVAVLFKIYEKLKTICIFKLHVKTVTRIQYLSCVLFVFLASYWHELILCALQIVFITCIQLDCDTYLCSKNWCAWYGNKSITSLISSNCIVCCTWPDYGIDPTKEWHLFLTGLQWFRVQLDE